jgi:uncharacterized repeat protein (TIGR01451 family)
MPPSSDNNIVKHEPPTCFGGSSFKGLLKLPFVGVCRPFVRCFFLFFFCFFSNLSHAALFIENPLGSATSLTWDGAILPINKNVTVLRYEKIGFFHYDPASPDAYNVWQGQFADQDSLDGTPNLLTDLPAPLDSQGNPIPINTAVPLSSSVDYEYQIGESFFILAEGPILPAFSFGTRTTSDNRKYIAVTIDVDNGDSYIISLIETSPGSGDYAGYFQPNADSTSVPDGSTLNIRYDNYGDVADSDTVNAPWLVDPTTLFNISALKVGRIASTPAVEPDVELYLSKQATRTVVSIGDFLAYELRLENTGEADVSDITIVDVLPKGFRYQKDSSRLDGNIFSEPEISLDGRELRYEIANLLEGESITLRYVTEVTVGAEKKEAINLAQAFSGDASSNEAKAQVLVENPFFNDHAFLAGRVMVGGCDAQNSEGLAGVRIYMEDGTNVITDEKGRWHIEGVKPGTHVLQLDTLTLGPRYSIQSCEENSRKAGNLSSRFVNVQGGTLWRENWYVKRAWHTESNIEQQLATKRGESGTVNLEISVRLGEHQFDEALTQIFVPENVQVVPGSARLNGKAIDDLKVTGNMHELITMPKGYFAKYSLSIDLQADPSVKKNQELDLRVESSGVTQKGKIFRVESINRLSISGIEKKYRKIVLNPNFADSSLFLPESDKEKIRQAAKIFRGHPNLYLDITAHTDNQTIHFVEGRNFNNHQELSLLRGLIVADELAAGLVISESRVNVIGKGSSQPIATNATEAGRKQNRRFVVSSRFPEWVGKPVLGVVEGYSGINGDDDLQENSVAYVAKHGEKVKKNKAGFVNLSQGMTFVQPVFSASALIDSKLKVKLLINGEAVSDGRIGMKMLDPHTGMTLYAWIGLDLDQVGDHDVELQGVDSFGNIRFRELVQIRRSGAIKTILVDKLGENVADGRTPLSVKFKLLDEFDKEIKTRVELEIQSGNLKPLNTSQRENPLEKKNNVVQVSGEGWAYFEPVAHSGSYQVRIGNNSDTNEIIEIPVAPELRDWILVGFAEGTLGYNTLEGNMADLEDEEDHFYSDGEASFFAKGKVRGEWLLTTAYDSRRVKEETALMQRIDPQSWYVLYGDDAYRTHDAPSREKLYVRIEKSDFYAVFGDYDTELSVTELTRFQRTLTGFKAELKDRNFSVKGFASQTNQAFIRDDIEADGTSGLYRLTNENLVPGSDEISIEVRDRFTNEVISNQLMTRYVDYSIDYFSGTLFFRQPVLVQDENFNPQRIVAKYELTGEQEEMLGGGRVAVHDENKKLELGLSGIEDNTVGAEGGLGGADLTWKPNERHTVKAETAASQNENLVGQEQTRQASLVEYNYKSERLDTKLRAEEQEESFGLGQQARDDGDTRSVESNTRFRINEQLSVSGDLSRQEELSSTNNRNVAESRLEYSNENWKAYGGLRHSEDELENESFRSQQVIAGGRRYYLDKRLALTARGESSIDYNENVDYPNLLSLGSDYKVTNRFSVFANQDFSWGEERDSQDTRVGVRAIPWQGGTVTTDVSRTQDEYGPRLVAHAGVFQSVPVNNNWSTDFGLDRSQTLRHESGNEQFDDDQPLTNGTSNDDYTAVFVGAGYKNAEWQWTNRVEHRTADTDDKWTFMSGFQQRVDNTDTIAGRVLHFDQEMQTGYSTRSSELDFSYIRRPLDNDWFRLNRMRLVADEVEDPLGVREGHRIINNTHFNFIPDVGQQLSLQYSLRWVKDTIDETKYLGFTDLIGAEYRHDITSRWDMGVRGSTMASWNSHVRNNAFGVMAGYSPVKDVWLSLGYNFKGFYDSDFTGAGTRIQGFVLDFRVKLDQEGAKEIKTDYDDWKTKKALEREKRQRERAAEKERKVALEIIEQGKQKEAQGDEQEISGNSDGASEAIFQKTEPERSEPLFQKNNTDEVEKKEANKTIPEGEANE